MDGCRTEYAPAGNPKQDVEGCRLAPVTPPISRDYTFVQSIVYAVGVALGFLLALLLMSTVNNLSEKKGPRIAP
ncbi:MAG: hypothetical protein LBT00_06325 [Spirochaetaceae bacterium]|jgi:Na+-transporting NADH:ubiquinone oxidoreductase subunit NqrE|nr:hypothetical protein [Spirochaetaceae bacterium]